MNKKEISEIKKQFCPDRSVITRMCTCYVDGEKNIIFKNKCAFNSISEDAAFKYYDIFKHTLSGTLGKNMLNMDFPINQESEGGTQEFLLRLKNSHLENDELVNEFFDKIIGEYDYDLNYYIVLIHVVYDVPGKTSDGIEMEDASDNVFEYILCSICPVNLSKPGLGYNSTDNNISERCRDWIVSMPANGFMFPVFNDRASDIHSVLYYSKNPEELHDFFIENILGTTSVPLPAKSQKECFNAMIEKTLGDECSLDTVKTIHESINELITESKDNPEPLILSKQDVKRIFEKSEVSNDKLEHFDSDFEETVGEKKGLLASNITNQRNLNIETTNVSIKVNPERGDLIETKIIDGRQCLIIPIDDDVEINGVSVKAFSKDGL